MANMGGRGGWRKSEIGVNSAGSAVSTPVREKDREELAPLAEGRQIRQPTPLRVSST